jgi:hypothetical protein
MANFIVAGPLRLSHRIGIRLLRRFPRVSNLTYNFIESTSTEIGKYSCGASIYEGPMILASFLHLFFMMREYNAVMWGLRHVGILSPPLPTRRQTQ